MADDNQDERGFSSEEIQQFAHLWGSPDEQKKAFEAALEVLSGAHPVNRVWTFGIDGNFEIVFGNLRAAALTSGEDLTRRYRYPCAVSLNLPAAVALHAALTGYLKDMSTAGGQPNSPSPDDGKGRSSGG